MSEEEKKLFLASGQLIGIAQAASLTPYSQEYLSLLARKGYLPAVKISRDWLTTREAVLSYVQKQHAKHKRLLAKFELKAQGRLL